MKTYVIVAQAPDGTRKMIWKVAKDYAEAKAMFAEDFPDHEAISMWLRVRT